MELSKETINLINFEDVEKYINIPIINDDCNFWMIRTNRGVFYEEYIKGNFIAIGWNYLTESNLKNSNKDSNERLKEALAEIYSEVRPQSSINKCHKFIFDLKKDDIVVIMGNQNIAFAKIGDYYIECNKNTSLEKEKEVRKLIGSNKNVIALCPYSKRRKIEIIKEISVDLLSPYLANSIISNHHSLSSLNDEAELVLSSCYDIFIYNNNLINTFKVQQKENIDSLDYATFVYNVTKILNLISLDSKIIIKTNVHSCGDIILTVLNYIKEYWYAFAILYIIIFGGKFKDFEFNSIWKVISNLIHYKERKESNEQRKILNELDIESKRKDIKLKDLQILEKEKELLQSSVKDINESAKALEIKQVDPKIIDINFGSKVNEDSSDGKT